MLQSDILHSSLKDSFRNFGKFWNVYFFLPANSFWKCLFYLGVILISVVKRAISSTFTTRLASVQQEVVNVIFLSSSVLREYWMEGKHDEGRSLTTTLYDAYIAK